MVLDSWRARSIASKLLKDAAANGRSYGVMAAPPASLVCMKTPPNRMKPKSPRTKCYLSHSRSKILGRPSEGRALGGRDLRCQRPFQRSRPPKTRVRREPSLKQPVEGLCGEKPVDRLHRLSMHPGKCDRRLVGLASTCEPRPGRCQPGLP